jgi:hypothetical protein
MIRMRMRQHDCVNLVGADPRRGEILRHSAERRRKILSAAGVDQDQLLPGIDQPGIDRRRDAHLGQVRIFEQVFAAGFIAGKQRQIEREAAIA